MNALPVRPQQVADADQKLKYFDDLDRWGFEIAYSIFDAYPYDDVVDILKDSYSGFVTEAHKRGYPACVQIQSTICAGDRVGIDEAQYDIENNPIKCKDSGFFASFASDAWKEYLKELTTLFVRQYGFDYVVFDKPMFKVDIPGSSDRFYTKYTTDNPDVKYPLSREESTEYLMVQSAKARVVEEFYTDLIAHAKSIGAKKAGVIPQSFIPAENDPDAALNNCCNIGRITKIDGLDFLVTGDQPSVSSKFSYIEILAHALGKDVIALSDPTDHCSSSRNPITFEQYKDKIISSLAAAPCGFTEPWCGQSNGEDDTHKGVLVEAANAARRLGRPQSPVAFVFSYSGTRHVEPLTYESVFSHYLALAKQLAFDAHIPMLTFHADTLDKDLEEHPEVQVLIFEEHFPMSVEQMLVIRNWWQSSEKRAAITFGSGKGFNADPTLPGPQPCALSQPGILELIGLRQEEGMTITFEEPAELSDISRVRRSAFLGDEPVKVKQVADVRRIFGSRASVLYEVDVEDNKVPVVAEWRDRSTLAVFCGFGLSADTASMAEKAIKYVLREVSASNLLMDLCSEGILWTVNAADYLIISNVSDTEGYAVGKPGRANLWDVREERLLADGEADIKIAPHSFKLYRVVGRRSKFYDVQGALCMRKLIDGSGRAEIELLAGQKTMFVLRSSPKEIIVDGKSCTVSQEVKNGVYYVTLMQCRPGERNITLKW
ncbi:hypothetical protein LLG46_00785 [bacterium]|nr:hypothetical protein [bacterium]